MFFQKPPSLEVMAGVYAQRPHLSAEGRVGHICGAIGEGTVIINDRQSLLSLRQFLQEQKGNPRAIVDVVKSLAGKLPVDFEEDSRSCERIAKSIGRLFLKAVKDEHSLLRKNFALNISPRDGHFLRIDPAVQNYIDRLNYLRTQVSGLIDPKYSLACEQLGIPTGKLMSLYLTIEATEARCELQMEKRQKEIKAALAEKPKLKPFNRRFNPFFPPRFFGFNG